MKGLKNSPLSERDLLFETVVPREHLERPYFEFGEVRCVLCAGIAATARMQPATK